MFQPGLVPGRPRWASAGRCRARSSRRRASTLLALELSATPPLGEGLVVAEVDREGDGAGGVAADGSREDRAYAFGRRAGRGSAHIEADDRVAILGSDVTLRELASSMVSPPKAWTAPSAASACPPTVKGTKRSRRGSSSPRRLDPVPGGVAVRDDPVVPAAMRSSPALSGSRRHRRRRASLRPSQSRRGSSSPRRRGPSSRSRPRRGAR